MLADTRTLLRKAQKGKYAIGHFNINDLEIMQGVVRAAAKLKAPLILATSEGAIGYAGMRYLYEMALAAAKENSIPLALHLDHGRSMGVIKKAMKMGYSSVMIDASHDAFEKNVKITRTVVQHAHRRGISVEAELGTIGGAEDNVSSRKILYTDHDKAKEFVERTDCDFLAVAIGTSHGAYKFAGQPCLKIDLLKKIRKKVAIPLVLHGASEVQMRIVKQAEMYGAELKGVIGVPDRQIKQAIAQGICKINTDTDIRLAFDAAVRKFVTTRPADFDPRHMLSPARDLIQKVVEHRIKTFGGVRKG